MAFPAKDGTKYTNADSMRSHNAMSSAPAPQDGEHDGQNLEELKQAFEEVITAIGSGQKPDPQTVKDLIQYFDQFIGEEQQEGSEGGEEEPVLRPVHRRRAAGRL